MKSILTILFLCSVLSGRAAYPSLTNFVATYYIPTLETVVATFNITNRTETNWVSIGTFTDKSGNSFDVEEGTRVTNTVVVIDYKGKTHELILETATGQKCDEHKVPKPPPPPTMWWTPLTNNTIMMTNVYMGTRVNEK